MQLHHIGYLVADLSQGIKSFQILSDCKISKIYDLPDQMVKAVFLGLSSGVDLELIEPYPENKSLNRLMKKGSGYYHLGFKTPQFQEEIDRLLLAGFKLISKFESPAFIAQCAFLLNPDGNLIELIESN